MKGRRSATRSRVCRMTKTSIWTTRATAPCLPLRRRLSLQSQVDVSVFKCLWCFAVPSNAFVARPRPAYGKHAKSSAPLDAAEAAIATKLGILAMISNISTDTYRYLAGPPPSKGTTSKPSGKSDNSTAKGTSSKATTVNAGQGSKLIPCKAKQRRRRLEVLPPPPRYILILVCMGLLIVSMCRPVRGRPEHHRGMKKSGSTAESLRRAARRMS